MRDELLPCPRCADPDKHLTVHNDRAKPDDGYRLIICRDCGFETEWSSSEAEAVIVWNELPRANAPKKS